MACGVSFYESLAEGGRGRFDQALAALERGRLLAEEISPPWLARYPNQRAWLSAELGDWQAAYEFDLVGLHPARIVPGFREIEISTLINLVQDCTALGRLEEARTYLDESQKDLGRPEFGSHNWRWSIRLADACARLGLAHGDFERAAKSVSNLLIQAERTEARKYIARALVLRSQVEVAAGLIPAAEAGLQAALNLADNMCYIPVRFEARMLLSELYRQVGSRQLAESYYAGASHLLADLETQIKHPELRSSFERGMRQKMPQER
jgi:hypothetical protein